MAQTEFHHIGLTCKNPEVVEEFYTSFFGFKRVRVFKPGADQIVMLKSDNAYLELFKAKEESPVSLPTGAGPRYPGWRHLCFKVESIEEKIKEIGSSAIITQDTIELSEFIPGMRACWIADPEGNIIELNQGYMD